MSQQAVILITLIAYKLVLIGIGLWAQSRNRSNADFFLASGQLGPLVASISYAASSSSAWTLLGVSGAAYTMGVSALWLAPGILACHAFAWFYIAPRLLDQSRERGYLTLTDVLAGNADSAGRRRIVVTASLIILFCFSFYVAAQFQGAGTTFATNFDMDMRSAVLLGGLIVLIYTLLGGFWAVSITDALQGLLMAAAAIVLPTAGLIHVGGWEALLSGLKAVSEPHQLALTGPNVGLLAVGFVVGILSIGLGTFGQPQLLNRFMALRDHDALRRGRLMAMFWFAIVLSGTLLLGLIGHVLSPNLADGETVFFEMTTELFSPIVAGVILAAVLSAIMSTADSQLLVAAASISHDLGLSRKFPGRELWISRIAIALLTVAAVAIAIGLPAAIFGRVLFAWNGLGAAFGPLLLARISGREIRPQYALTAMITGFVLTVVFYSMPNTPGDVAERVIPFVAALAIVWMGSQRPTLRVAVANDS